MARPENAAFTISEGSRLDRPCYIRSMHSPKFYFAFFWFSHRTGGGEANA